MFVHMRIRIAVEIGWGHKAGGSRRVTINTLLEMIRLRPDHQYIVFSNSKYVQFNDTMIVQNTLKRPPLIPQVIWDQFLFPHLAVPLAAKKFKADVIHYTNHIMSYWERTPAVVTIHDMTPFILPEAFIYWHGVYLRSYFRFAVKNAAKIITDSENSKADICRILKVNEKKIVVIPDAAMLESVDEDASTVNLQEKFGIVGPYLLYVGSIHPRKNVGRLIEAYAQLKTLKGISHQLVIAGTLRWQADKSIKTEAFKKVKDSIIFTGRVNDNELVCLYRNCDVFVYPSLYEGFGLPVLEAMSLGAPVVTSNISSLPEVAGDAALLVNPRDIDDISYGIESILSNQELADQLREKGRKQASLFSWKDKALKVLEVLESVVSK